MHLKVIELFGLPQFTFIVVLLGKAEVEKIGEELGLLVEQVCKFVVFLNVG